MTAIRELKILAQTWQRDKSNAAARSQFVNALAKCTEAQALASVLEFDDESLNEPVYQRLEQVVGPSIDLLLAHALWLYFHGNDAVAHDYFEKAKMLAPFDHRILIVDVWLAFNESPDALLSHCDNLLVFYPDDEWALSVRKQLATKAKVTQMSLPDLKLEWR